MAYIGAGGATENTEDIEVGTEEIGELGAGGRRGFIDE